MKTITKTLSICLLAALFIQSVAACGPFTVDPLFAFTRHADYPLRAFSSGKMGIVPKSYGRMSLYVFYRELNNLPLSADEQTQFVKALSERIGKHVADSDEDQPESQTPQNDAVESWKKSRAKVFTGDPILETEKRLPDDYFTYTSCLNDAFRTASNTLENRISTNGIDDNVKEWVNGQDTVFKNCGEGGGIPDSADQAAPTWLKKDRDYQIAAALLYAGKNAEARDRFEKISVDDSSVWKNTAKFVVARTYIREASFLDESDLNKSAKTGLLQKAVEQLNRVLADSSMREFHPSAERLLNLTGFRADPLEQRRKLAERLTQKGENPNLYYDLIDYIWLLDQVEYNSRETGLQREQKESEQAGKEYGFDYQLKRRDVPDSELGADLTDWLFTYQAEDGFAHSYSKWQQSKSLAWFASVISHATKDSPNLAEILNTAEKLPSDSPGFATVVHHQIRLLIETGKRDEARQKLEKHTAHFNDYPRSTQNDFYSQKMQLAKDLDEFLKYAQRRAATFVWSDDANEEGDGLDGQSELKPWKDRPMFDYDSADIFNQRMPLSVLREAALNPNLPVHLKKFLVVAVWTRAFVLGNSVIQKEFNPLIRKLAPEFKVPAVTSAANSLLVIGRNPSIQIYVPVGYGREDSASTSIDSIRGNWWCFEKDTPFDYPAFLTAAQVADARNEQRKLASSGESATFLARSAVEFANKFRSNRNTPEILHLGVRATRYGCRDGSTLQYSKAAFDILHSRFPQNTWTRKTPYYFGEREN